MTTREFDPLRLDVAAFAREAGQLDGRWPVRRLLRVAESASPEAPPAESDEVVWSARGESRPTRGSEPQTWLHLRAHAPVDLECQRCLHPVHVELDVDRNFLFVHGEETAAKLDEETEDDVLAMTRALNVRDLVEDELLLSMPLVPRHEVCPEPLIQPADTEVAEEAPNPFAALAGLKREPGLN